MLLQLFKLVLLGYKTLHFSGVVSENHMKLPSKCSAFDILIQICSDFQTRSHAATDLSFQEEKHSWVASLMGNSYVHIVTVLPLWNDSDLCQNAIDIQL